MSPCCLALSGEFEASRVKVGFKEVFSDIAGTRMMLSTCSCIRVVPNESQRTGPVIVETMRTRDFPVSGRGMPSAGSAASRVK